MSREKITDDAESRDPAPKRRLRVPVLGALATAVTIAGIVVLPKVLNPTKNTKDSARVTRVKAVNKKALVKELKTAYEGPIALKSAKNTGEVRSDVDGMGDKRAVVRIQIGGTAINHKTADNRATPTYYYSGLMETVYLADDPSGGITGITSQINNEGEAEIYPRLDNFTGKKPVTLRYVLGVGAEGPVTPGHDIAAVYSVGEVDVTGSDGRITSLRAIPPEGGEAHPQIVEPALGYSLNEFLR